MSLREAGSSLQQPEASAPASLMEDAETRLLKAGKDVDWMLVNTWDMSAFADRLQAYCERTGEEFDEYVQHSSRFANLDPSRQELFTGELITIPPSPDNVDENGEERPEDQGYRMDIDSIRSQDIDPAHVLYFRYTQPARIGTSKPEYFWTSDFHEVVKGRSGSNEDAAIILVSTLEDIARASGIMSDINDDSGISVRQIGLEPYDQNRAMFAMPRIECVYP